MTRDREGLLWGSLGVLAFSLSLPATRAAVPAFGAIIVSMGRAEVAALIALVVLLARHERFPGLRYLRSLIIIGSGVVIGFPVLTSYALRRVPASHGAIVIAVLPAATAVFAVIMAGERPPRAFWGAVAFGMTTVLVFAAIQGAGHPHKEDALLLGAVIAAGLGYAEGGRLSRELGGWRVISWALVITAPFLLPFVIADLPNRSFHASPSAWLGLAYVCVVSMFLGFLAWYRGLALGGIARVGQIQLAQPVLSLMWAWLLLDETIGWEEIAAGFLVVGSVVLTRRFRYSVDFESAPTPVAVEDASLSSPTPAS